LTAAVPFVVAVTETGGVLIAVMAADVVVVTAAVAVAMIP
jgi:hypothetical protein